MLIINPIPNINANTKIAFPTLPLLVNVFMYCLLGSKDNKRYAARWEKKESAILKWLRHRGDRPGAHIVQRRRRCRGRSPDQLCGATCPPRSRPICWIAPEQEGN